ncbi:MAG: hypothetical protein ACXAC2_22610, partial [Candidatus Kariarchaeaceae archaeon]
YKSVYGNTTAVTTLEPDYGGIAPFHPYYAESLTINGTEFFLSHTIAGFEIFEDVNSNGFIDSHEEIKYFVMLNATQGFTFGDVTNTTTPDGIIYRWSSSYFDIDGFLVQGGGEPTSSEPPGTYTTSIGSFSLKNSPSLASETEKTQQNEMMKTIISSFNISYMVEETDNYTDLSIKYDIGSWDAYSFTFDEFFNEVRIGTVDLTGLGLSILYTSIVRSNVVVESVETSTDDVLSEIKIIANNEVLFEADLDESYTLAGNPKKIPVKTVIAPKDTFLQDQTLQWAIFDDFLENIREWYDSEFELHAIPSSEIPEQEIFNYRISYPDWSGEVINHDPVYRINKFQSILEDIFNFPLLDASNLLVIGSVSGFFMIGVVLIVEKRKLI